MSRSGADDGHDGVSKARDDDGQNRSLWNGAVWVLMKREISVVRIDRRVLDPDLVTLRSPDTLAPARIPIPAGK